MFTRVSTTGCGVATWWASARTTSVRTFGRWRLGLEAKVFTHVGARHSPKPPGYAGTWASTW